MDAEDFDIIVIGGGAGGGTLAAHCATAGKRVLLVERGRQTVDTPRPQDVPSPVPIHDEAATLIDKEPYDDRQVEVNGTAARLYMGGILGGGTSVYGGALVRPGPADFSPGMYYADRIPREIRDWPISYSSFEPFLEAAERLYHVSDAFGTTSAGTPHATQPGEPAGSGEHPGSGEHRGLGEYAGCQMTRGGPSSTPYPGLPLAGINQRLMQAAEKSGLTPYRLPLAIDASRCLRCDSCAGFVCPTGARRSSGQLVEETIAGGHPLTLRVKCEAIRLERGTRGRLAGVWLQNRADGSLQRIRARRYVLAAGAIGSAALLLKSGFDHPQAGRNYMMHYSPLAIGIFAGPTGAGRTFVKQVGCSDYYFGTRDLPEKMGIIQSLPAPGPLMMAKSGLKRVPVWIRNLIRARMLPLVGIVEDLPDPENRVTVTPCGAIQLRHQFSDYDRLRGTELARQMSRLLRQAGALHSVTGLYPTQEHVAHQCGTLRFGTSRSHACADPECRLFDLPDVFVADGSFMPTSLGVGPSLTIIGNALRVAGIVASET